MQTRSFVGLDVHKATIAVGVAEDGRNGEVRFLGKMPNTLDEVAKALLGSNYVGSQGPATLAAQARV
jgi:hypothetical protein